MMSKAAAFDAAATTLRQLGVPGILPRLHANGVSVKRMVLGGSHSVAVYPPIDSLQPMDGDAVAAGVDWGPETSLYIHVAFCETRCTFCHYAVEHFPRRLGEEAPEDGPVSSYLAAVRREIAYWGAELAASGTVVSSVYVGGGTPLVLGQRELGDLVHTMRDHFDVAPGAELCIEGSPLTITAPDGADKLRYLKELGATRLSFGIQSFDDTVLKYAARGYQSDCALRACAIAGEIFSNWNLDLIQGLYMGSPDEVWHNLTQISEVKPAHLTWYHGRFADRPQGQWYQDESKRPHFEDEPETLLGRMLIWQELATLGYERTDGNRFVRASRYVDPFKKVRTSASSNLLGIGAASYSHAGARLPDPSRRGYIFRNEANVRGYVEAARVRMPPIATGRTVDAEELLATSYATGLRTGRVEDRELQLARSEYPELSGHYDGLVHDLVGLGVLKEYVSEGGMPALGLTELGRLFEDETLALFFSPAVKSTLARQPRMLSVVG
jgi:coproporphyrinogen III oxidase-like Fe-S oxidoreductase